MEAQQTAAESVLAYDHKNGKKIVKEGQIVGREEGQFTDTVHFEDTDGNRFEVKVSETYNTRHVYHNDSIVGKWTALIE
jgi:hypothetical protein